MTDVPDAVADVFESRDTFVPSGEGYVVETTSFTGHVTANEGEKWKTDYEVTVRTPTLQAATADEVGDAVRDGWFETFERRLEDAPKATRVAVDVDEYTVEYVEGTYVEGIIPGYNYVGVVADLMDSASTGGSEGSRGGTPL